MKNIIPLFPNLSRAYEIAMLGNFSINVVFEKDYIEGFDDYKTIKNFFGEIFFSAQGEITCQILKPNYSAKTNPKAETLSDIITRVNSAKTNPLPTEMKNESSIAIFNLAINKLNFSLNKQETILKVAAVIAQLDKSPTIAPEHVAEAIQYSNSYGKTFCNPEEQYISFGNNIKIYNSPLNHIDIQNAIDYLSKLL